MVANAAGQKQHVAVGPAVFFGIFDIDAFEAFADGASALIGGEDAFAGGDHRLGDGGQIVC